MSATMQAAVIQEPGRLAVLRKEISQPGAGEVLIRVRYCGICATDNMIHQGIYSRDRLPLVPGHEFVGRIAAVGPHVRGWTEGDAVTADINGSCGTCPFCLRNQPLACPEIEQIGIHRDGGFAEYVVVPARKLMALEEDALSPEQALAEPLSNAVRSLSRCGSLLGRSVAVVGGNFMSLLHLQAARMAGAWPLALITDNTEAASLGESMGADRIMRTAEAGGPQHPHIPGWDVVFETQGTIASYRLAHSLAGPGTRLLAFGLPPQGDTVGYEPFRFVLQEQTVLSSVAGAGSDLSDALALIASGRLDLQPFTACILPLEEIGRGLEITESDGAPFKVFIEVRK